MEHTWPLKTQSFRSAKRFRLEQLEEKPWPKRTAYDHHEQSITRALVNSYAWIQYYYNEEFIRNKIVPLQQISTQPYVRSSHNNLHRKLVSREYRG